MSVAEPRFECTACGACCKRPGVLVINFDELPVIAEHLETTDDALATRLNLTAHDDGWWLDLSDRPCPLLRNDRCSVHHVKPSQCRAYPFWPEIIESEATWAAEQEFCPGIGRGPAWDEQAVLKMLNLLEPDVG